MLRNGQAVARVFQAHDETGRLLGWKYRGRVYQIPAAAIRAAEKYDQGRMAREAERAGERRVHLPLLASLMADTFGR